MEEFGAGALWKAVWQQRLLHIILFSAFLSTIILFMVFKDRLAKNKVLLSRIRYGMLGISFLYGGLVLKAQPSTANMLILHTALKDKRFPLGLFLLEPFIFLSFAFIILTMVVWGRGAFCGWVCPYGAMLELLNRVYGKLFPNYRWSLPDKVYWKMIYVKYLLFFGIAGIALYDFFLAEYLTEVEPFRTFVLKLKREWFFDLYFVILTAGSVVVYRAFCRYLCPLGAGIAVPSFISKIPLVKMRRYDFCKTCRVCSRTCEPKAIDKTGSINSRECLGCLDCQGNFWDEDVCPVLIKRKRSAEPQKNQQGEIIDRR